MAPPRHQSPPHGPRATGLQTRISGIRSGVIASVAALIVVMIFIIQNVHAVFTASSALTCAYRWP
jgi:hypothetical protein